METTKINWVGDFSINESLHSSAKVLAGAYARMSIANPEHKDAELWKNESFKWVKYNMNIKDLYFATEAEGKAEADRLVQEVKKVFALEDQLIK
jgi:hypothetical protein